MKPKLPRALLWTDKTSMEEFLKEPVNEKLYEYYLYIKSSTINEGGLKRPIKLFNEIYYQLTRFEYENDLNFDVDRYIQDIKANIGSLHSSLLVLRMMSAFLLVRENNPRITIFFLKILSDKIFISSYADNFIENVKYNPKNFLKKRYNVDLTPKPCNIKDLDGELLRWDEITNNFNSSSIKEVLNLWTSNEEKINVLHMIEDAYMRTRRRVVRFKEDKLYSPLMADYNFFSDLYSELGSKEDHINVAAEEVPLPSPTYVELEEENYNLKKKIAHLESDNERMRSESNSLKSKKKRERSFTLSMIVDYSKKHLNYERSSTISGMLNKFLRDARDYTQEECELVDSIEIELSQKKYGDTVMGDKNEFRANSTHNTIKLPSGMTPQEAMKLLQNKTNDDDEKG